MTDPRQHGRPPRSADRKERVLFIGLGAMGTPMSGHLATAGYETILCDLRESHVRALGEARGVRTVALGDASAVAPSVTAVVLMLPDSGAVEHVVEGEDGLLAHLRSGATIIDMSSSRPASTVRLAAAAQQRGLEYVDAPVSGGVARAGTGELAIMAGGAESAYRRVLPLLEVLGSDVTHVGPAGSGHAMKALNNLLSAIGLVGASEVLAIGAKFGLRPQVMLDVLNNSTGGNHATRVKMGRFVLSGAFDSGFALQLMVKDLRTALELAHDTSTPTPLAASCLEEWMAARQALGDDADHTHIAAYVEARAGIELR